MEQCGLNDDVSTVKKNEERESAGSFSFSFFGAFLMDFISVFTVYFKFIHQLLLNIVVNYPTFFFKILNSKF